jgi:pyruvate dehydrogenase E2 component (dihydrolipoamide acetyltransferase)
LQVNDGAKGVQVGAPIAILAEEGDDLSGADKLASESSSKSSSEPKPISGGKEEREKEAPPQSSGAEPNTPAQFSKDAQVQPPKEELEKGDRIFASPIAKKIALERGIPLAKIKGSGPNGRILREDVEKYQPSAGAAAAAGPTAGFPTPSAPSPDYIDTPVSNMRRTIGSRLTQSKQEVPHYYLTADINMDKVLKLREVFNQTLGEKDKAAKLSVNDFIVKATACALSDVPEANSAWLGETIRQ